MRGGDKGAGPPVQLNNGVHLPAPAPRDRAARPWRTPAMGGDHYLAYRRALPPHGLKVSGKDAISRHTKARLAKDKSQPATSSDVKIAPQAASIVCKGRAPKRCRAPAKESSEEKSREAKLLKSPPGRPLLCRRSRTFVIESHGRLHVGVTEHSAQSREDARFSAIPQPPEKEISYGLQNPKQDRVDSTRAASSRKAGASAARQRAEERSWREAGLGGSHGERVEVQGLAKLSQWGESRARAEARLHQLGGGPVSRPKSAGQLPYYDSDDSDGSSLHGEIEIVDIDKELENDPEPSPYWRGAQPHQVPQVLVQTGLPDTRPHDPGHQSSLLARQRHDSGDWDVFSDSLLKPRPAPARRRFLSEPEIAHLEDEVGAGPGADTDGGAAPRQRLLSDSMERVLWRYSRLGLGAAPAPRAPPTHIPPPRKLKPILKQPRNEGGDAFAS